VQTPAPHQVVAPLVDGRHGVQQDDGGDGDGRVGGVPGAVGARDVAGDEEERGPGVDPGYAPGVVVEELLEVQEVVNRMRRRWGRLWRGRGTRDCWGLEGWV